MLTTSCNFRAAHPFRGAGGYADPVARKLRSFLLLVITLLLPPVVFAQAQTEIKGAEPADIFRVVNTAPVVVNGEVWFHVVRGVGLPGETPHT